MARQELGYPNIRAGAMRFLFPSLLAGILVNGPAAAQGIGCVVQTAAAPQRQVLHCRDGLILEAEAGAGFDIIDSNQDASPDAVRLQNRAIFIDAPKRSGRQGFRVITPQAIAAVRGTQWAVDVSGGKTAVFVVTGRVSVRRAAGTTGSVSLGPGEGVDVEPGAAPLVVRRWPAARAAALLTRFGR